MSDTPEARTPIRRPRKTPEERGPVGWWAYRTMVELGLSDAQIASRVGVGAPTIRKFMGSPDGELGATSRKAMLAYYREVATATNTPIDEPPPEFIVGGPTMDAPDQSAILAAIDRQTAMLERVLTAITGQMIPPDRLMALETWMDWMAANPSQPQRSPRRPAKQRSAPTL